MKNRKDAWSPDDDRKLTETVLEYKRNGDSKTSAYKMAAEVLDRTPSACRYRWTQVLKEGEHQPAIVPDTAIKIEQNTQEDSLEMHQVIDFLRNLNRDEPALAENQQLKEEQQALAEKNNSLTKRLEEKQANYEKLVGKYQKLLEMMQEAEKLLGNNGEGGFVH